MSHDKYKEWLYLAVSDELPEDETRQLHAHLTECEACELTFAELSQTLTLFGESGVAEPTDEMLWEARGNLRDALSRQPSKNSVLARVTQSVAPAGSGSDIPRREEGGWRSWFTGFRAPLTGFAGAAAGFVVAMLVLQGPSGPATTDTVAGGRMLAPNHEMGEAEISNVRFVNTSARSDVIEVEYDLIRPVRLKADATDPRMKGVLAHAITSEPNTGVRLAAMKALDSPDRVQPMDDTIKAAFLATLRSDANPAVRREALRVLQSMPFDIGIRDACFYVLENDNNAALRIAAINILASAALEGYDPGPQIYDLLDTEENDYVRFHTGAFIKEVDDDVQ